MKKILIVDDDSYKVENIKKYINQIGEFEVVVADSRSEGMRHIIKNPNTIDYIILDMCFPETKFDMPNLNMGIEFMEILYGVDRYSETVKNTKIIVCSSEPKDSYDFESVIGIIKYDNFVYLLPQFKSLLI